MQVDEDGEEIATVHTKNSRRSGSRNSKNQKSSLNQELKEDTSDNNLPPVPPSQDNNEMASATEVQLHKPISDFQLSDGTGFKIDSSIKPP